MSFEMDILYTRIFRVIKDKLGEDNPESCLTDFEMASFKAANLVFGCQPHLCLFHLAQSVIKHIKSEKLFPTYLRDDNGKKGSTTYCKKSVFCKNKRFSRVITLIFAKKSICRIK